MKRDKQCRFIFTAFIFTKGANNYDLDCIQKRGSFEVKSEVDQSTNKCGTAEHKLRIQGLLVTLGIFEPLLAYFQF